MFIKTKEEALEIVNNFDSKSAFVIEGLFTLMNAGDDKSLEGIFNCMKNHPCELVRHEAAFCLGEMASEQAISVLKECYEKDKSLVVKHECLMSLGTIGREEDLDFVSDKISHVEFEVKCSAIISRDRILQTNFFDDILEKRDEYERMLFDYKNTSQNDRIQILFKLMTIGDDRAIEIIYESLLNDPCRVVRHEGAFTLGEFKNKKATEFLMDAISKEKTGIVKHEGLFAIGTTGDKDCLNFVKKYLDDEEYIVRESAQIAVDRINLIKNPYSGILDYEEVK